MLLRLAIATGFNVACALAITYLVRIGGSFTENLVFSLCIGTLAWLFIDGGRMLVWGEDKPAGLPFLAMTVLALLLAANGRHRAGSLPLWGCRRTRFCPPSRRMRLPSCCSRCWLG